MFDLLITSLFMFLYRIFIRNGFDQHFVRDSFEKLHLEIVRIFSRVSDFFPPLVASGWRFFFFYGWNFQRKAKDLHEHWFIRKLRSNSYGVNILWKKTVATLRPYRFIIFYEIIISVVPQTSPTFFLTHISKNFWP